MISPPRNLKQALIRTLYPIAKKALYNLPGGKTIGTAIYNKLNQAEDQWMLVHGVPMFANTRDYGLGSLIYLKGYYAPQRRIEVELLLHKGDNVIDCGANIGYFTLLFGQIVGPAGKVYAFEPDPRNCRYLRKTIEHNIDMNVEVIQKAVSNKVGQYDFYQGKEWTGNSLTENDYIFKTTVEVTTLDACDIKEKIRLVKMDMDGSEAFAIEGMKELIKRNPDIHVIAEFQPPNVDRYLKNRFEYIDIAKKAGLKLISIYHVDTGRLPDTNLEHLVALPYDSYLDLHFIRDLSV